MKNAFFLLIFLVFTSLYAQRECFTPDPSPPEGANCNPSECLNSIPIKYLGVHVIFLLSPSGGYNFNEKNDGLGNSNNNGYIRAEHMIDVMNWMLSNNQTYGLDPSLPVCQIKLRVFLKSVQFIRTSNYDMNYLDSQYADYMTSIAINSSNDFTFIHHYNSQHTNLNGERVLGGYGPTNWVTTWNDWNNVYPNDPNYNSRNSCHELFHALNLSHAWSGDFCNDTKNNSNQWCGDNNNVMDYNCAALFNLTPCQICRMHDYLNSHSAYIDKEGDCPPPVAFFDLPSKVCRSNYQAPEIYMQATASTNEDKYLIEIFEVEFIGSNDPVPGTIFSAWYSGQAFNIPLKQKTGYNFQNTKIYRVKLGVDNNNCSGFNELIKYVTVQNCFVVGGPSNPTGNCCINDAALYPNPTNSETNLYFTITEPVNVVVQINGIGLSNALTIQELTYLPEGNYMIPIQTDILINGLYTIQIILNNSEYFNINLVVQH